MKNIKHMSRWGIVLAILIIAGCITTGTVVVTARLAPNDDGESIIITDATFENGKIVVDLNDDPDFKDYKAQIKNIDNIGFYMEATNNEFTDANVQLFLEPDTSKNWNDPLMPVDSGSNLIFTGFSIPGRTGVPITKIVNWEQSFQYITGLADVKSALETGVFAIYPNVVPRAGFNVTIDSLVIIITLTGNK